MRTKETGKYILKISKGILSTITDFLLWEIAYIGIAATTFSRNTWEPVAKTDKFLEEFNYESIKTAIEKARARGWIKRTKKKHTWPEITKAGMKRLSLLVPEYDEERVWDKKFYLVTYDIPEKRKRNRELLRQYLKRIGAGMIQESVWLTPYNPNDIIREFIQVKSLRGTIIVSNIGKDGNIGEEDIKDLVTRVYKLDKLNKLYKEFLEEYEDSDAQPLEVSFAYWNILRRDPQLPFELLPRDWLGEKVHKLILKVQKPYSKMTSS